MIANIKKCISRDWLRKRLLNSSNCESALWYNSEYLVDIYFISSKFMYIILKLSSTWNCIFFHYPTTFVPTCIMLFMYTVITRHAIRERAQLSASKMCLLFISMTMVDPGQLERTFTICKRALHECGLIVPCHSILSQGRPCVFEDLELCGFRKSVDQTFLER